MVRITEVKVLRARRYAKMYFCLGLILIAVAWYFMSKMSSNELIPYSIIWPNRLSVNWMNHMHTEYHEAPSAFLRILFTYFFVYCFKFQVAAIECWKKCLGSKFKGIHSIMTRRYIWEVCFKRRETSA